MPTPESEDKYANPLPADQAASVPSTHGRPTGLAQYFWQRHNYTSGLTIRRFQQAFVQRHLLANVDRLPILSAVQRRWGADQDSYPGQPTVFEHLLPSRLSNYPDDGSCPGSLTSKSHSGGVEPADQIRSKLSNANNPLQTGLIDQPNPEHLQTGSFANNGRTSQAVDLPVAVTPATPASRMEAPIVQRRKNESGSQDLILQAASQSQERPQDNRTTETGLRSAVGAFANTPPTVGNPYPATGSPGIAIPRPMGNQPGIHRKFSAAEPGRTQAKRESNRRKHFGQSILRVKANHAVVMQKKIIHRAVTPFSDGSRTGSAASGSRALSTDAALVASKEAAEEKRRQAVIKTESENGLAADVIPHHKRTTAIRLSGAKAGPVSLSAAEGSGLAPGTDGKIHTVRMGSGETVSGRSGSPPFGIPSRSFGKNIKRTSFGYQHPTMMITHPNHIIREATRQNRLLPLSVVIGSSPVVGLKLDQTANPAYFENETIAAPDTRSADQPAVPSLPQANPKVFPSAENRGLPQMMIQRTFTPTTVTGSADPATAADPASRPLVQLSVVDRSAFARGPSMRSSKFQSGGSDDTQSRPPEPGDGSSENDSAASSELDQLVDKILQKLMRRIAIEKERRGLQRWP